MEKVREINPSLEFEALSALSVEELKDLRETGAPTLPIGKDKALEIAMTASGFSADEVYTETDSDLDENPAHYDVEIKHNGTEYEYKIDAYTGEILTTKEERDDDYAAVKPSESGEQKKNDDTQSNVANTTTEISLDSAKEIALNHAGVKAGDAVFNKAKLDYDDGRAEYDREFVSGNTEYEYDIDAATGAVISSSVETKNIEASQKSSGGDIGEEKARTIALNHAGVGAGDAYELEAELDHDDGVTVYEIEFKSGNMEYEYKIDA